VQLENGALRFVGRLEALGTITHTVEEILNRKPHTFAQWAAAHADAFR
jgi:hypothetical protein